MIGIVNLNMSLDKIYRVKTFEKGEVTRVDGVIDMAGGKGTHVANVCQELNIPYLLTGFIGGATGQKVTKLLDTENMQYKFIEVNDDTRICLNIIDDMDKSQTEFLEKGPSVTSEQLDEFLKIYDTLCQQSKVIVISGSGYRDMPTSFYGELCTRAKLNSCEVIVDASGENLVKVLESAPTAIKPNKDEVKVLLQDDNEIDLLKNLQAKGIKIPIISRGSKGAMAAHEDKIYEIKNPQVNAVNSVGSGDAFIAGLAIGLHENYSVEETLKLACACGTANALQLRSGYVDKTDVDRIKQETTINII